MTAETLQENMKKLSYMSAASYIKANYLIFWFRTEDQESKLEIATKYNTKIVLKRQNFMFAKIVGTNLKKLATE